MPAEVSCPTCFFSHPLEAPPADGVLLCKACGQAILFLGPDPVPVAPTFRGERPYAFARVYARFRSRLGGAWARCRSLCANLWTERERRFAWPMVVVLPLVAIVLTVFHGIVIVQSNQPAHSPMLAQPWATIVAVLFWVWIALVVVCAVIGSRVGSGPKKDPALAMGVAAASGFGAVLIVLLLLLCSVIAGIFVAGYVLVLLMLMVLSLVVFVPMRLYDEGSLLWRRIARRCPYDDCGRGGLPIHVCSCGARYPDLRPNFYGIFHHTCWHGQQPVRLPTLDAAGRRRLPRLCRHCERPIALSSFGELSEKPIALIGTPAAGKTVFLRQAARALRQALSAIPGAQAMIDSPEQQEELRRDLEMLDRGLMPPKTAGDVMQAFALAVRLPSPHDLRCLLYLFDAPGEHFATVQRFGRKLILQHLGGIILLVDPCSLPGLTDGPLATDGVSFPRVVETLLAGAAQLFGNNGGRCGVPLAVVLSKRDALRPEIQQALKAGSDERVRTVLLEHGAGNEVRALEQHFGQVRYFTCSALGRPPAPHRNEPYRPQGILEPLLWLIGVDLVPAANR